MEDFDVVTPALSTSDAALFQECLTLEDDDQGKPALAVIPNGYTAADTLKRVGGRTR